MKRVLITAPLRQSVHVFRAFQDGLDALLVPDGVSVDRFFVVNDCPEVIQEIHNAEYVICDTNDTYEQSGGNHLWSDRNLAKMVLLRNMTIRYALENGYDYWFSVDTDVVVQPETLRYLLEAEKDIISEIFWTRAPSGKGYWCNAWMYDQDRGMSADWLEPGLYRVGMTGACTLVNTKVFKAGVDYTPIHCIREVLWGEDRWFGIRAAVLGFEAWLDTHCPAAHLYTEELYQAYMRQVAKT